VQADYDPSQDQGNQDVGGKDFGNDDFSADPGVGGDDFSNA